MILLVLIVFLATLGVIMLIESFNKNDSIASAVAMDVNITNNTTKTVHSNITFRYIVTYELTKNSANKTIVKYYTKPRYTTNSTYYYSTNRTKYYYTKPTYRTYTYTYYVYV